ncbi:hypothetical protein BD414DRAFT_43541 [Trametes punicea]|nr:hypothetical protein BD414DRAFT_43541 [Trametes punicea]
MTVRLNPIPMLGFLMTSYWELLQFHGLLVRSSDIQALLCLVIALSTFCALVTVIL